MTPLSRKRSARATVSGMELPSQVHGLPRLRASIASVDDTNTDRPTLRAADSPVFANGSGVASCRLPRAGDSSSGPAHSSSRRHTLGMP